MNPCPETKKKIEQLLAKISSRLKTEYRCCVDSDDGITDCVHDADSEYSPDDCDQAKLYKSREVCPHWKEVAEEEDKEIAEVYGWFKAELKDIVEG
jgi:hypothetical protein